MLFNLFVVFLLLKLFIFLLSNFLFCQNLWGFFMANVSLFLGNFFGLWRNCRRDWMAKLIWRNIFFLLKRFFLCKTCFLFYTGYADAKNDIIFYNIWSYLCYMYYSMEWRIMGYKVALIKAKWIYVVLKKSLICWYIIIVYSF